MKNRKSLFTPTLLLLGAVAVCGCSGSDSRKQITEVRNAPEGPAKNVMTKGMAATPQPAPVKAPPITQADKRFTWDAPQGWDAQPPNAMRLANFTVTGNPKAEIYFTVMPGEAGGIAANVNRWRKQMGQGPYTQAEIDALPRKKLLGQDGVYVDLQGAYAGMGGTQEPDFRLLGLILVKEGEALFVKMTGPAPVVEKEQKHFDEFTASIKQNAAPAEEKAAPRPAPETPAAAAPAGDASAAPAPNAMDLKEITAQQAGKGIDPSTLKWTAPSGWTRDQDRMMRVVTYKSGDSECYVSLLSGEAGGAEANINRWQQQMGQQPLDKKQIDALPTVPVMGKEAPLVSIRGNYTNMQGEMVPSQLMLGVVVPLKGQTLFVKMVGPEPQMQGEHDNFIAFCKSIQ